MANHKSALKEHRQSRRRRTRNRGHASRMRTALKKFRALVGAGEVEAATGLLPSTVGLVDRTAKLGAIHDKAAGRIKSRLARALNKAGSGA